MKEIKAEDAKARFAELLRDVEDGETIAITQGGKTVAHLIPADAEEDMDQESAVDLFLEKRAGWRPTGMTLEEIVAARNDGRRL